MFVAEILWFFLGAAILIWVLGQTSK
jgi:hypothetical protein